MAVNHGLFAAFLIGLLGGVHCAGMCGGIVGALTLGLPESIRSSHRRMFPYHVAYNVGRILSYTLAGALVGGLGQIISLSGVHSAQLALQLLAGLFLIALGLYLGGWWLGLAQVERTGALLWRRIEPLGRRFIPVQTPVQALVLGMVWGWLPCGLVYSVLVWALATGSIRDGAAIMLVFGLGTLPNLLAMGVFAAQLSRLVRSAWTRWAAGALVIAFGAYTLAGTLRL
jgi:sulfite exporter TauE/SafE